MSRPVKGSLHQRARDMRGTHWCRECLTENMTLKCEDWLKNDVAQFLPVYVEI